MDNYPYTLTFVKHMRSGFLKGYSFKEKLGFCTKYDAMLWVDSINKQSKEKKINFSISGFTINNWEK